MLAGLLGAPTLLLAACGPRKGAAPGSASSGGAAAPSRSSAAVITVSPAAGTTGAAFTAPVTVTVAAGTLDTVKVTDPTGQETAGRLAPDGTSWTSTAPLASSTAYTVAATATDRDELVATAGSSFTTAAPARTFTGHFTPENGAVVGVGMPVSITFTAPIGNRRAVQQAITVTADSGVEVVGHWISGTRLDFRPEQYWAKGTKVTVKLRLKDVEGAKGVYGTQSKDVVFTVGRAQTSVADLAAGTLTVTTDGRVSAVYKVIGGSPQHRTWGGKMVISERSAQTRMNSSTVGLGDEYDIPDVPHAQRLTASGTFIHGNYWSAPALFGKANTSHGCIALRDVKGAGDPATDGARFYASSLAGDVVEVVNSGDRTVDPANGLGDWNLSWADWKAGSAL
jgi:hypothetical protein